MKLIFVEQGLFGEKAQTHRGGRIEIWDEENGINHFNHNEEITVILPNEMWERLRNKLDGFDF
jgi:hypothetical protein